MHSGKPPFRFIAPGRVYRADWDMTHTPMFHQIEGLVIDKNIHMGHLKYVIIDFIRSFFLSFYFLDLLFRKYNIRKNY